MVRVNTRELDILAKIVFSLHTKKTVTTGYAWFHSDSVPFLYIINPFSDLEHNSCCFVSKNAVPGYFEAPNGTRFPEVYIGPIQI